jgi:hypothetical protein
MADRSGSLMVAALAIKGLLIAPVVASAPLAITKM